MITSKKELQEYILSDNAWFSIKGIKQRFVCWFCKYPQYEIKKYLLFLRKQEYYINTANGNKIKSILALVFERKKNRIGYRLGIDIQPNCFGKGLNIYHNNIIVNSSVKAGENCSLHGNNCIGNNGIVDIAPKVGNNVDIGFGAIIIGDVHINDNTIVGANALVNKSFPEGNCVIAGVPARIIKTK